MQIRRRRKLGEERAEVELSNRAPAPLWIDDMAQELDDEEFDDDADEEALDEEALDEETLDEEALDEEAEAGESDPDGELFGDDALTEET